MTEQLNINALIAEAQERATQDQTVTPAAYERTVLAKGKSTARFIGYIEIGKQPQRDYQGAKRNPEDSAILMFEFNSKKHARETDDGVVFPVKYETITIKLGDKGNFKKLFNKMRQGRDSIKHMAHMLGEGFIIDVQHNQGTGDKADQTYANIRDADGSWLVSPPMVEDAVSGEVQIIPVPAPTHQLRLFLWDNPSKLQWDSLFIDGTRTKTNKDGTEEEVTNNWIQERIVKSAVDFEGSALEAMLLAEGGINFDRDTPDHGGADDAGDVLEDTPAPAEKSPPAASEPAKAAKEPEAVKPAAKAETKAPEPAKEPAAKPKDADDLMKELGLD